MNPRSKSKSWPARLLRRARCLAARPSTPSRAGRWESRQGVTPFYRHLQQYSIKPELDGHEDHLKHMQSADGAVSCGGRSHYTVAVHTTPKNLRYEVMDELRVYAGAFEDDLKTAVREKINDGEKDWLPSYWDMFKSSPAWTCYRADRQGVPAAIFMAYDQGRGEAFLNALRTDPAIRRGGIATSLIRGMDKDLASKGFTYLRMATTSANEPMIRSISRMPRCQERNKIWRRRGSRSALERCEPVISRSSCCTAPLYKQARPRCQHRARHIARHEAAPPLRRGSAGSRPW